MPLINVKVIEGVFSPDQKKDIVTKLTDAMVSVGGENLRPSTWVLLEEVASGEWGVGGHAVTTEDAKGMASGEAVA